MLLCCITIHIIHRTVLNISEIGCFVKWNVIYINTTKILHPSFPRSGKRLFDKSRSNNITKTFDDTTLFRKFCVRNKFMNWKLNYYCESLTKIK